MRRNRVSFYPIGRRLEGKVMDINGWRKKSPQIVVGNFNCVPQKPVLVPGEPTNGNGRVSRFHETFAAAPEARKRRDLKSKAM